jgi:hypothetical protein
LRSSGSLTSPIFWSVWHAEFCDLG